MSGGALYALSAQDSLWPIYAAILLAAFVKYLLPFLPGDMVLLVSTFWVGMRGGSWSISIAAVTLGGFAGACLAFLGGGRFGERILRGKHLGPLTAKVVAALNRWGFWPLLFNRFLPYVRPVLYPAAGMIGMPAWPVVLSAFFSNLFFGIFLVAVAHTAGRQFSRLQGLYELYQFWLGLLAIAFLATLAWWLFRGSKKDPESAVS